MVFKGEMYRGTGSVSVKGGSPWLELSRRREHSIRETPRAHEPEKNFTST